MSSWVIAWGDRTWSEDDLTMQHLVLIVVQRAEDTWDIDPVKSPLRFLAVLAAFIAVDESRDVLDVVAELGKVPVVVALAALQIVES